MDVQRRVYQPGESYNRVFTSGGLLRVFSKDNVGIGYLLRKVMIRRNLTV